MHSPEDLKMLVDEALERLDLWPELHGQATSVRYALEVGGKRVRPVISLAVGEALGAPVDRVMPAALAIELVHTFSLVHDDLPAMDDDEERRGHPATWKKFGEGVGVLAGDALLAEAVRLAARYESSAVTRELAEATLGMIGGQYLDTMVHGYDLAAVHRLKTGRLFFASVTMALWAAGLPEEEQAPWRAFAEELGLLFQIVDDILDVTGSPETLGKPQGSDEKLGKRTYVTEFGLDGARGLAQESHRRARAALAQAAPDGASQLEQITDFIATRTF
jgi:geranylgeranyl diphosphate synthase, type II